MKKQITLSFVFLLTVTLPTVLFAGGGGSTKSRTVVRVKNTSTAPTSPPLVALDTVEVADAGNTPLTVEGTPLGAVAQSFRMGKSEVTIAQYARFLNTVARRTDGANGAAVASLYDARMASDAAVAGIARIGEGTEATPFSYSALGDPSKPIAYVTWFNAARFANWLHNGATESADIETGAYTLNGALSGIVTKNPNALWWIPSEDEWFKAAYYKGGGTNSEYSRYPTQSDDFPGNSSSAGTNQANFLRLGLFSITQSSAFDAAQNYLTAANTFTNSPSAYGTFDQGGNLDEWTDGTATTAFGIARITRGGAWNSGGLNNDATPSSTALPSDRSNKIGFRLARSAALDSTSGALGAFLVKAGSVDVTLRRIGPNEMTQFSVRQGAFTVEAQDAANPNIHGAKQFTTGLNRVTRIALSIVDGALVIQDVTTSDTF